MTVESSGWYPDPTGDHRVRYWTGTSWSAWVADDGPGARTDSTWHDQSLPPPVEVVPPSSSKLPGCLAAAGLLLLFVGGGIRACDLGLSGDEARSWARPAGVIILVGVGLLLSPVALAAWGRWKGRRAWPLWYGLAPLLLVGFGFWGMASTTTVAGEIAVHGPRDCGSVFSPRHQHAIEAKFECDDAIAARRARSVTWIGVGLGATVVATGLGVLVKRRGRHEPAGRTARHGPTA